MYERAKRVFDLLIAVSALALLLPPLIVIAAVVSLSSPGSAIYRGRRIGRYGRPFHIYKFRTMVAGAERFGSTTAKGDPRVTSVGRLLRRYKVDEFPQLVNVIKGEMSLVGPRPEVEEHTREYSSDEQEILTVMPGITDYASLRFFHLDEAVGSENAHDVYVTRVRAEKNRLRLEYVRRRSFREDLRIIARTMLGLIWARSHRL
jgi:lipopolysaccharide/colanic/teichoic acid biosynthesis glycosyltransferase